MILGPFLSRVKLRTAAGFRRIVAKWEVDPFSPVVWLACDSGVACNHKDSRRGFPYRGRPISEAASQVNAASVKPIVAVMATEFRIARTAKPKSVSAFLSRFRC